MGKDLMDAYRVPMNWFGDPDPVGGEGGETPGDGGDGGEKPGDKPGVAYLSQASPDIRKNAAIVKLLKESAPTLNDLITAYAGAHGKLARAVVIPNAEKPDPAEVKALREVLGIPEKEDGYGLKFDAFKDLPTAQATAEAVTKHAAASTMTKVQAQKTLDFILGIQKASRDAAEKAGKEYRGSFEARLLEAVGGDVKKRDTILNFYKRFAVKRFGDAELIKRLDAHGFFHDAAFASKLARVEADLSEEPWFDGEGGGGKPPKKGKMGAYDPKFVETYGEGA